MGDNAGDPPPPDAAGVPALAPPAQAPDDVAAYVGKYFSDFCEDNFAAHFVKISIRKHPDHAIRRVGLVQQHGTYGGESVIFDERSGRWRLPSGKLVEDATARIRMREDRPTSGVIHVVGCLDISQTLAVHESNNATATTQDGVRSRVKSTRGRAPRPSEASPRRSECWGLKDWDTDENVEGITALGDPSPQYLSAREMLHYMQHYIVRGVVAASVSSGASIIYSGTDDIATLLGRGYATLVDPYASSCSHGARVLPKLVGVNAAADEDFLDLNFSHHLMLRTDGSHKFRDDSFGILHCANCDYTGSGGTEYCAKHPQYAYYCRTRDIATARVNRPLLQEILAYKHAMLVALNRGFSADLVNGGGAPPNRDAVPVAVVVIGGTEEVCEIELHNAVMHRWPILVVEGSGGYADRIITVMAQVERLLPQGTDARTLLSVADATIAEIISSGNVTVVSKGTEPQQFSHLIQDALRGGHVLRMAWALYCRYHENARIWGNRHEITQFTLLTVSLSVTSFSVLQTFLLLLWNYNKNDCSSRWRSGEIRADERYMYVFFVMVQWLVIGFPITLTLVHAMTRRLNGWVRLSALRIASESVLKEIYLYRTKTGGYSDEAVALQLSQQKKKKSSGVFLPTSTTQSNVTPPPEENQTGTDDKEEKESVSALEQQWEQPYGSREELLGRMLAHIEANVAASDVVNSTLVPTKCPLPPPWILETGDTGLADMTADEYAKYRLRGAQMNYDRVSNLYERQVWIVYVLICTFGAVGSILAAFSTYGLGYLQAWVPFATALVDTFTRYLEYSRISSLADICSTTAHQLSDMEGWYAAEGNTDSTLIRTKLVAETERLIQTEVEMWAKQLQKGDDARQRALEASQRTKEKEDRANSANAAVEAEEMKALGTDALAPAMIESALGNPDGPEAKQLKKQLLDLNDRLGSPVPILEATVRTGKLVQTVEAIENAAEAQVYETAANAKKSVTSSAPAVYLLGLTEKLSQVYKNTQHVSALLTDPVMQQEYLKALRSKFERPLQQLTSFNLLSAMQCVSEEVFDIMKNLLTPIEMLATVRQFSAEALILALCQCIGDRANALMLEHRSVTYDEMVREIAYLSRVSGVGALSSEALLQIVHEAELKSLLLTNQDLFMEVVARFAEIMNDEQHPARFAYDVFRRADQLVMEGLMEEFTLHTANFAASCDPGIAALKRMGPSAASLSRFELLSFFPPNVQAVMTQCTFHELLVCIRQLAVAPVAVSYVLGTVSKWLTRHELLRDVHFRGPFLCAVSSVSQRELNQLSKGDVVRWLRAVPVMTAELCQRVEQVFDDATLRDVISRINSASSRSHACHCIDVVSDKFSWLDLRTHLTWTEKHAVVRGVVALAQDAKLSEMDRDGLLDVVPSLSARKKLSVLLATQLRKLYILLRAEYHAEHDMVAQFWRKSANYNKSPGKKKIAERLNSPAICSLIYAIAHMAPEDVPVEATSLSSALEVIGEPLVTDALTPTQLNEAWLDRCEFSEVVADLFSEVRKGGNQLLMRMWSRFEMYYATPFMEGCTEAKDVRQALDAAAWVVTRPRDDPNSETPPLGGDGGSVAVFGYYSLELPLEVCEEVMIEVREFDFRPFFTELRLRFRLAWLLLLVLDPPAPTDAALSKEAKDAPPPSLPCLAAKHLDPSLHEYFAPVITQAQLFTGEQGVALMEAARVLLGASEAPEHNSEVCLLLKSLLCVPTLSDAPTLLRRLVALEVAAHLSTAVRSDCFDVATLSRALDDKWQLTSAGCAQVSRYVDDTLAEHISKDHEFGEVYWRTIIAIVQQQSNSIRTMTWESIAPDLSAYTEVS